VENILERPRRNRLRYVSYVFIYDVSDILYIGYMFEDKQVDHGENTDRTPAQYLQSSS
jgi:hypothetical protein